MIAMRPIGIILAPALLLATLTGSAAVGQSREPMIQNANIFDALHTRLFGCTRRCFYQAAN